MKFNHKKRNEQFHDGFKAAIQEVIILLKEHKSDPIEKIIIALENAVILLDKK